MSSIVPTIMPQTAIDLQNAANMYHAFTQRVHIDFSDGLFAPNPLLSPLEASWQTDWQVDIHLMYKQPSEVLDHILGLRPSLVILHAECDEPLVPLIQKIKAQGVRAGIAFLRSTVPSEHTEALSIADHAMIFSGNLGEFGGSAHLMQIEKIRLIRKLNPSIEIGWDGGVSIENAYNLAQGGVDVLNAGGYIANADQPVEAYNELVKEIRKHGVI